MKKILIIILATLSLKSAGQTSSDPTGIKMFNKGLDFYSKGNLDSALSIWTIIVDKKIGSHYDTYGNAFFNIPNIYWQKKDYQKAKEWYYKILQSDLKDNDETGSLMEPHTNYKHKSAVALAGLYEIDSNNSEILQWLNKADTLYRYWGFEGSATNVSQEQAYLLNWKVEVLLKLNKKDEAIKAILTELICAGKLEIFFSKSEEILLAMIDKKAFKNDFDIALNNLSVEKVDPNNWAACFKFHGLEFKIPISNIYPDRNLPHYWTIHYVDKSQVPDTISVVQFIKERSFYTRLTN